MSATSSHNLCRTPLHDAHVEAGGQMVDFAGWQMPIQYAGHGLLAEHHATRRAAGLFDVSHMGEILVEGPHAVEELDRLLTNRVGQIAVGQAAYSLLCHEDGGTVDDLYVYRLGEERFLVVVNAANRAKDFDHMRRHAREADCFTDRSDDFAMLALQGPAARAILADVAPGEALDLARNYIRVHNFRGADLLVATTGYTGERGFEIYTPPEIAVDLWRALSDAGRDVGLVPVGLGARDTLRLEMGFALYGHELRDDINGYEAGLGWVIKLAKGDFVGREALAAVKQAGPRRKLVGLEMVDRGIARDGYPILSDGAVIGAVTSGTRSPTGEKSIAMALIDASVAATASEVDVEIHGRPRRAKVVRMPFVTRS